MKTCLLVENLIVCIVHDKNKSISFRISKRNGFIFTISKDIIKQMDFKNRVSRTAFKYNRPLAQKTRDELIALHPNKTDQEIIEFYMDIVENPTGIDKLNEVADYVKFMQVLYILKVNI